MFKINLPNPRDMEAKEFFAQMRIALKSAEKSYEEMVKGIELNEDNTPWISYRLNDLLQKEIESIQAKNKDNDDYLTLETTEDTWQDIILEINRA